jgi:predicted alpha/beta-fold hydrolase
MTERLKVPLSKSGIFARGSRVRISLPPPLDGVKKAESMKVPRGLESLPLRHVSKRNKSFWAIINRMKTSFHRIITKDNLELASLLYEPETGSKKILVHVHGMAGNFYENKFLDFIAQTLTDSGIAFFVFNNRGCELIKDLSKIENEKRSIVRFGNAYEIFEDSEIDIKTAIDFVSSNGFSVVHLSGHSLGAPKVAYYAAEVDDNKLSSVIFLSPSDMVGLIKMDKNYGRDMNTAKNMIADGKGDELLPFPVLWDQSPLSAKTYVSLGDKDSKVAIFNFYNPNDTLPTLSKIKIPTLAVMGAKDDALVISIEDTMDRIKKASVGSSRVVTNILGDADHGYNNFGQQLADVIKKWIQSL